MSRTGTHSFHFAGLDWEVSYTFTPGAPEAPPAYAHGGLPADPDEVELFDWVILTGGDPLNADELFAALSPSEARGIENKLYEAICEKENDE